MSFEIDKHHSKFPNVYIINIDVNADEDVTVFISNIQIRCKICFIY